LVDPAHQHERLGDFLIEGVLGQGGSGIVYDAKWGPRRVALKVLHPSLIGTGRERAQFLTEAQRLQQIMHPSVVKVLALGQLPDGRPYLAMERLNGETLASVLARGALPLDRALSLFRELCSAVAALHAQGLVHRDLKPENVFVVDGQHAVLLDFGIAKDITAPASTTTQEGNVRGTPAYMAPERFFGNAAGIATDIYELALVLYIMLAGRLPWDEVADPEARLAPRSLADLAPVSEALDVEIRRALSTRAQNRPSSATALLEAVEASAKAEGDEPEAASTARLRSGAQEIVAAAPAAKQPTAHDGVALAATEALPTAKRKTQRTRVVVFAALAVTATAAAVAFLLWPRDDERDSPKPTPVVIDHNDASFDPNDPWSPRPVDPAKTFALVDDAKSASEYRVEAATAVQKLPQDTRFVFTVQLAELRAQSQTNDLLDKIAKHPKVAPVGLLMPPCVKGLLGDAEWLVFGAPSLEKAIEGTLVLRGRWRRSDVESCFADSVKAYVTNDGAKLYRIGDDGWLDFLDDHTAVVTMSTKLEAEALHKLTKKPLGPVTRVKAMIAKLPAERSLVVAADGTAKDDWSMLSLPKGTDVYGWIRIEPDGITLDLAADPHNPQAMKSAIMRIKPQLDELFANTSAESVGKLEAVPVGTAVHVRGRMTALMISLVTAGLTL
jgi:serine/threonine protein kinase